MAKVYFEGLVFSFPSDLGSKINLGGVQVSYWRYTKHQHLSFSEV